MSYQFEYLDKITDRVKNGNYYILYGSIFSRKEKLRLQVDSIPDMIPEYPELVDMKITDACQHKCPFCYMASTPNGKHAELRDVYNLIHQFKYKTEFALGGGNVLLHPDFTSIVKRISEKNHIANITIRYDDVETIKRSTKLKNAIKKYVSGIGISVQSANDVDVATDFINQMLDLGKHVSLHIIPEMIGVNTSVDIFTKMKDINQRQMSLHKKDNTYIPNFCRVLFLGLKQSGRAKNLTHNLLTADELTMLRKESGYVFNVDTAFINTYSDWFKEMYEGDEEFFLTRHEGEYSMFIDAVNNKAYASSYKTDVEEGIDIGASAEPLNMVFGEIRRRNGFKVFEKPLPYYRK